MTIDQWCKDKLEERGMFSNQAEGAEVIISWPPSRRAWRRNPWKEVSMSPPQTDEEAIAILRAFPVDAGLTLHAQAGDCLENIYRNLRKDGNDILPAYQSTVLDWISAAEKLEAELIRQEEELAKKGAEA